MADLRLEQKITGESIVPVIEKTEAKSEISTVPRDVEPTVRESPAAHLPAPPLKIPAPPPVLVQPKDELTIEIEGVLEEDLGNLFAAMPADEQEKFKQKGEEVLGTIRQMFAKGMVRAKKIIALVVSWLQMIPGVNRFFIEQEAKIKTDKIMALKK